MTLSIIGIVLGLVAIGLFIWFKRDQEMTNDLVDSDLQASLHGYNALMDDFTNYQVKCDDNLKKNFSNIFLNKIFFLGLSFTYKYGDFYGFFILSV